MGFGFLAPRLSVVRHDEYTVALQPMGPGGIIDPQRPRRVEQTLKKGLRGRRVDWLEAPLVEMAELELVHPPTYLEYASQPTFIAETLGIPNVHPWETDIWQSLRRVIGGTVLAAKNAVVTGRPTFNLSGGFHHAWPKRAAGFCVINDIAVAVAALRAEGFAAPVAVVDLDYHHGDGTEACLVDDHETMALSLHTDEWHDTGKQEIIHRRISPDVSDAQYLAAIDDALIELAAWREPKLVMYVAGADPAQDDRLCNMRITPRGMLDRDLKVWRWARDRQAALSVVPAGGYGPDAWRPLAAFGKALLKGGKP